MIPKEVFEETLLQFFAPIRPYLDDATVSEIMINGPNQIFVERRGQLELVPGEVLQPRSAPRRAEEPLAVRRQVCQRNAPDPRRAFPGRVARRGVDPPGRPRRAARGHTPLLQGDPHRRSPRRFRLSHGHRCRVAAGDGDLEAQHHDRGGDRKRQDLDAQCALRLHPGWRARRRHRGLARSAVPETARRAARGSAAGPERERSGLDPRSLPRHAPHAPRSRRRRRDPRRRGARHRPGDDERSIWPWRRPASRFIRECGAAWRRAIAWRC